MKLHKLVNRRHKGVTYFRFLIMVPPEHVVALRWTEGQELEMEVEGRVLRVRPMGSGKGPTAGGRRRKQPLRVSPKLS